MPYRCNADLNAGKLTGNQRAYLRIFPWTCAIRIFSFFSLLPLFAPLIRFYNIPMPAKTLQKGGKRPSLPTGQRGFVSASLLQQHYTTATNGLGTHFPVIDAWLAEHAPDLWQQIRQEDDELFRLCRLGVPERTYQDKLDAFLALCERAEQLYYEAQPEELSLPPLAEDERVAVYYALADGSLHKVSEEEE
jgi:hypothetical protein